MLSVTGLSANLMYLKLSFTTVSQERGVLAMKETLELSAKVVQIVEVSAEARLENRSRVIVNAVKLDFIGFHPFHLE